MPDDYPDISHPWPDSDNSGPVQPTPRRGPGLLEKDIQLIAAINLLEANGYKVIPVKRKGK